MNKRLNRSLSFALAAGMLATSTLIATRAPAGASSHREAPLISNDAQADTTDVYAFVSPDRQDSVTLIGSWIPLESPEGGPNYYKFGDDVLYTINIDNDGDAKPDVWYEFDFDSVINNPNTFLYNTGSVTSLNDPDLNVRQYYTVTEVISDGVSTNSSVVFGNKMVPPVNIGSKSTPNFAALSDAGIYSFGSGSNEIKVFAGQSDDPFWVDLGSVFDLLSLRGQAAPIGYSTGKTAGLDGLAGYNVHSIAIQVPITRALTYAPGAETVIGVWASSSRQTVTTIGALNTRSNSGPFVQVSRLGMPLVNEAVIPLALKDAFNSLKPEQDAVLYTGGAGNTIRDTLQKSVEDPELGNLLCGLYGVPLPGDANDDCATELTFGTPRSGRGDIFDVFLTGMVLTRPFTITTATGPVMLPAGFNVNRPANAVPAEMIRLNTAIKGNLCSPTPQRLGVLAGDACGFPNGRRLQDDVTEIELLAVAGAAYPVLDARDSSFTFNPALIGVLTDGLDKNDKAFRSSFPYLAYAHQGQEHQHPYLMRWQGPYVAK